MPTFTGAMNGAGGWLVSGSVRSRSAGCTAWVPLKPSLAGAPALKVTCVTAGVMAPLLMLVLMSSAWAIGEESSPTAKPDAGVVAVSLLGEAMIEQVSLPGQVQVSTV